MTPRFKAGDYDGGIEAGVGAIIAVLEGRGRRGRSGDGGGEEFATAPAHATT